MSVVCGREDLHPSLSDPALGAISFLNEVMGRFPAAISFAPGAPHPELLPDVDVTRHVRAFLDHLSARPGMSPDAARRALHEYGPSRGLIGDLIARMLNNDQGMSVAGPDVVVTVGAQEAMLLAVRALCRPGQDSLAVVVPCFPGILGAARLLDVDVVAIEHPDELGAACATARSRGRRIRALYVAPDYSNPGGDLMDLGTRRRLLASARQHDVMLLEDNAYGFTAAAGTELPTLKALDAHGRVLYVGTFAKTVAPGHRVGYLVAGQQVAVAGGARVSLADEIARLKTMVTVNTSPMSQAVIGGMLLAGGCSQADLIRPRAELYRRNLALLLAALSGQLGPYAGQLGIGWNQPSGGFFVRLRLPVVADLELLELSAARFGVLWTPMSQFYPAGIAGDGGAHELRLACSYLSPGQITEGVGRLAALLQTVCGPERTGAACHVPGRSPVVTGG